MFGLGLPQRFYLCAGETDIRKSFDGVGACWCKASLIATQYRVRCLSSLTAIATVSNSCTGKAVALFCIINTWSRAPLICIRQINPGQCVEMTWTQLVLMVEGLSVEHTWKRSYFFTHKAKKTSY
jgi:hypothetical protein